ncbi:uncharacterized protein MONBRDRAFT_6358 [Monosiga brevicollis MX1]|uniref:IRS-type PTB domain-containing protein n=1 Tax=Monosiga brevicollis TaxID=81824 RepID=A9UTL6_MONBE|nr:uncharacterized protein MONBRDRAFT_6358 [Monosiga brevicollis MX1]EDQ91267.1 predicted protein [Monosiga brevicollis MX1]|eukprot:XP_001743689.1 hypothetical protein [Monosiga brevicollis MX1]
MGNDGSKPWLDFDDHVEYSVVDLETKSNAIIAIAFPKFYFYKSKSDGFSCSLGDIRGYAQRNRVFSFETGRNCPGGPAKYTVRVKGRANIHQTMNDIIKDNMVEGPQQRFDPAEETEQRQQNLRRSMRRPPSSENTYDTLNTAVPMAGAAGSAPRSGSGEVYNTLQGSRSNSGAAATATAPLGGNIYNHIESMHPRSPVQDYDHLQQPPTSVQENTYNVLNHSRSPHPSISASPEYNSLSSSHNSPPPGNLYNTLQATTTSTAHLPDDYEQLEHYGFDAR